MTGSAATHNLALDESVEAFTPEELFTRATGVHGTPKSWPDVHGRPDVIVRKGLATLINTSLTPHQALVEDLLFVRDALIAGGVDFVLVRGNDERPVLVVDAPQRRLVEKVLAAACADEPFYSRTVEGRRRPPVLVADGTLSTKRKASIFRLFRPRLAPLGGLSYGSSTGIELQFWSIEGDDYICPVENSLTRRVLPLSEAVPATVELFGRNWDTFEGMFEPHATDVRFDIDIVFSWVDGNDVEFQKARAKRMKGVVVGEGDEADARFRQVDELKYALRSVYLFAPWVRNIFIATDSPRPEWLAEHPRVQLMRSEQFFSDPSVLPTHNSQAVESQLQNIPGLSEHFLYSNDDMFFGRPVQPALFFSPGGVTKFIEATTRIGLGASDPTRSGFENAARVNRDLLRQKFGHVITRHLEHTPAPLRKSVIEELAATFPQEFKDTAASRFRSKTDISVTNSLYHYYALLVGRAVTQEDAKVFYVDTTQRSGLASLTGLLRRRQYDMFCLNDGSFPEVPAAERAAIMGDFLEKYYPIAAPWEKTSS
ncbi:stealth family protein [Agreia sp. COWG]|uniref:stealth family protein n=1 Tax=Agreia sp. COWG TaxID=2773266 RepID=UPI001925EE0C|nr:stealth family protein [Agreia sp. COWG]CAD5999942.1 Exopolysaccharide phosphotransferase CpsY [Agreia sp. COWG]